MVRLYQATIVAERFHLLPSQVLANGDGELDFLGQALESDPHQLDLLAVTLLNYASAKRDFDDPKGGAKHSQWKDTPLWDLVSATSFELAAQE